jgi:Protein of unknown function (DUF3631)
VYTENLISALILRGEKESEPWATIKRNGAPIDAYYLRGMLKGVVRRESDQRENIKSGRHYYTRANFEEAWARYIPADPENDPGDPGHPGPEPANPPSEPVSAVPDQNGASGTIRDHDQETPLQSRIVPDEVNPSGTTQAVDPAEENDAVPDHPDVPDQNGPDANTYAGGDGASDPDAHCAYCKAKLNGAAGVMHGGATFHLDACLAEHLKKQGSRAP